MDQPISLDAVRDTSKLIGPPYHRDTGGCMDRARDIVDCAIDAKVDMQRPAHPARVRLAQAFGAEIVMAERIAETQGRSFIHPFEFCRHNVDQFMRVSPEDSPL